MTFAAAPTLSSTPMQFCSILPSTPAIAASEGLGSDELMGSTFAYEAAGLFAGDAPDLPKWRWADEAISRENAYGSPRLIAQLEELENSRNKQVMGAVDLFLLTRSDEFESYVDRDGSLTSAGREFLVGMRQKEKVGAALALARKETTGGERAEASSQPVAASDGAKTPSEVLGALPATPPEDLDGLMRSIHAMLSRMQPTGRSFCEVGYDYICPIDGDVACAKVMVDPFDSTKFRGIILFNMRPGQWMHAAKRYFRHVVLHPTERTQEQYRPGTEAFSFAQRIWTALVERLTSQDPAVEAALVEQAVAIANSGFVTVPISALTPEAQRKYVHASADDEVRIERDSPLLQDASLYRVAARDVAVSRPLEDGAPDSIPPIE